MTSPEESDVRVPDIVAGRRVRRIDLDIAPGLSLFVLEAEDPDLVLEETARDRGDAYAAILWPSAVAAARRLPGSISRSDVVLDLGAGAGLVALTAARLGARAIALDPDPFSRALIAESARLQNLDVVIVDIDIDAGEPLPDASTVVMADILYEPELARAAARRALETLARGSRIIVVDPGRFARAVFEHELRNAGVHLRFDDVFVRTPGESKPVRVGIASLSP